MVDAQRFKRALLGAIGFRFSALDLVRKVSNVFRWVSFHCGKKSNVRAQTIRQNRVAQCLECSITLFLGVQEPVIAACPDGRTLLIRDVPEPGGSTTGCGESELCIQFEPSAR